MNYYTFITQRIVVMVEQMFLMSIHETPLSNLTETQSHTFMASSVPLERFRDRMLNRPPHYLLIISSSVSPFIQHCRLNFCYGQEVK